MNAPIKPPEVSRERTAREQADVVLIWHDALAEIAGGTERTAEQLDRMAADQLESARRCASFALSYRDPETCIALLRVAGRYACTSIVAQTKAKELRGR